MAKRRQPDRPLLERFGALLDDDFVLEPCASAEHLVERLLEQAVVVLFEPFVEKLAWYLEHQLTVLAAHGFDRLEPGMVVLGRNVVFDDRKTPLPHCRGILEIACRQRGTLLFLLERLELSTAEESKSRWLLFRQGILPSGMKRTPQPASLPVRRGAFDALIRSLRTSLWHRSEQHTEGSDRPQVSGRKIRLLTPRLARENLSAAKKCATVCTGSFTQMNCLSRVLPPPYQRVSCGLKQNACCPR
ncbi:hypothetical protein HRbin20_01766 [bacterium HR20]|nr:hypothetical protein HRbin20_01766 [bacterium HR20]